MLFRQMRYFVAVVECGSFTEAAEQCYISQSAISQQIQSLERELGILWPALASGQRTLIWWDRQTELQRIKIFSGAAWDEMF